jgi:hypothetical protein
MRSMLRSPLQQQIWCVVRSSSSRRVLQSRVCRTSSYCYTLTRQSSYQDVTCYSAVKPLLSAPLVEELTRAGRLPAFCLQVMIGACIDAGAYTYRFGIVCGAVAR